ncbi:MAG: superoxide dismutase [Polycyclovorans sp.]|nr:superoxide dismutase [Polycyclovorans sp.]
MNPITRRDALGVMLASASAPLLAATAAAPETPSPASLTIPKVFRGNLQPRPLRFDPAKLRGLSERLIRSHWENNYIGSVKTLNLIEARLAAAMAEADFPAIVYGGLKREELHRVGSVILHEHYFDNLGGDGRPGGALARALAAAYGSVEAWEAEFRRTAMSLSGGAGWCVLSFNACSGELRNQWAWDHMHGAIGGLPLLVLDMYEHSYHLDYGSAAAKYLDAFLANVDWEIVEQRFEAALRAAAAMVRA